jgi:hypothetical protein
MKIKTAVLTLMLSRMLSPALNDPCAVVLRGELPGVQGSISPPTCETIGTNELTLTCAYSASSPVDADSRTAPRIILNRAVISFIPSNDSHMRVELTFTNESGSKIVDRRTAYLAIDDDKGENHMRRSLPHVDFTKLELDKPVAFQETLPAPAFSPGTYLILLWIPSTDPSLRFDPKHNFLVSSNGVTLPASGLNQIGKFTITVSSRRKTTGKPD